ncbi:alpha/beta fold hydrolase [uncultured Deinococcus sp.]|uniref:alpha/beta hydrolase family protein n=1 Tax=uncultured Deinococcus sp. TaxID=158789 RepID=UPI00258BB702|nr:alpha/beta fold hydrolase [uncultured Deinococcus sp.]
MPRTPSLLSRLRAVPPRRLAGWAALGYAAAILAGALVGAEITLRSKTRRIKGEFVPVGRRGGDVYLPATPETLSRGVIGIVPLRPSRGHALLGPPQLLGTLVRRRILEERGVVPNGSVAWASTFVYNGTPAQLGLPFQNFKVPTAVGEMPAWHIPPVGGERDAVAIVIHGHGGQRAQALRMLPALRRSGVGSVFVTFRNAYGAPRVGQGFHSLGDQEAEDVLAALEWAARAGYRRAVLYGFSMGGNIALCAAQRPERAALPLAGVLLDCPVLDWRDVIRANGQRFGIPGFMAAHIGRFVEWLVTRRSGQDFDLVDQLRAAPRFTLPVMLWHGTRDRTVPVGQADALAAARPDLVEYRRVEGAKHIRCWNLDPGGYDAQLETFIRRVLPGVQVQGEPHA